MRGVGFRALGYGLHQNSLVQGTTEVVTIFRFCTGFTGEVQTCTVVTIGGLFAVLLS